MKDSTVLNLVKEELKRLGVKEVEMNQALEYIMKDFCHGNLKEAVYSYVNKGFDDPDEYEYVEPDREGWFYEYK